MSQQQNTTQETEARGSYISVAASITSKLRCFCCTDCSTVNSTNTERPITVTTQIPHEKININDVLSMEAPISLELPDE